MSQRAPDTPSIRWLFFSPSGRIGRQIYALSFLFWVFISGFSVARMVVNNDAGDETGTTLWFLVFVGLSLASAVSLFFLSFKRLHDMGFPGMIAIATFIPVLSIIFVIALMAWPSTDGPNEHGRLPNRPQ